MAINRIWGKIFRSQRLDELGIMRKFVSDCPTCGKFYFKSPNYIRVKDHSVILSFRCENVKCGYVARIIKDFEIWKSCYEFYMLFHPPISDDLRDFWIRLPFEQKLKGKIQ